MHFYVKIISQEAKNMFIKALDAYIEKCQELTDNMMSKDQNDKEEENQEEVVQLEQMMTNFTSLLQGFAFQFASKIWRGIKLANAHHQIFSQALGRSASRD